MANFPDISTQGPGIGQLIDTQIQIDFELALLKENLTEIPTGGIANIELVESLCNRTRQRKDLRT